MKNLLHEILDNLRVSLSEEFDKNFERKGFFEQGGWKQSKTPISRGSLLMRTGGLRKSIRARVSGNSLILTSSKPYAAIHNEGGDIVVTQKMKRFFWAKYYELSGKIKTTKKGNATSATKKYSLSAEFYKGLALKKVGSKIKIPQRKFIGDHPEIHKLLRVITEQEVEKYLNEVLKPFKQP